MVVEVGLSGDFHHLYHDGFQDNGQPGQDGVQPGRVYCFQRNGTTFFRPIEAQVSSNSPGGLQASVPPLMPHITGQMPVQQLIPPPSMSYGSATGLVQTHGDPSFQAMPAPFICAPPILHHRPVYAPVYNVNQGYVPNGAPPPPPVTQVWTSIQQPVIPHQAVITSRPVTPNQPVLPKRPVTPSQPALDFSSMFSGKNKLDKMSTMPWSQCPEKTAWVSRNLDLVWNGCFKELFSKFPDPWTFTPLLDVRDLPYNRQEVVSTNDSAKIRFICEMCGNKWTSMKGRVLYFIKQPEIFFLLTGQKCKKCLDSGRRNVEFSKPLWYPEEVVRVVLELYKRVSNGVFGVASERRRGQPRQPHNSAACEACVIGVCQER